MLLLHILLMFALIVFACSNEVYECRNFCVKIWVVTLAVGTYNTIKKILLLIPTPLRKLLTYKLYNGAMVQQAANIH